MLSLEALRQAAQTRPAVLVPSDTLIELLNENERLRAAASPAPAKRNEYPTEFEAIWEVYPARPGDSKKAAHKAWAARAKAGVAPAVMLVGAQAYAAYAKANRVEPQFIKQAATFFGPGEWYAADWTVRGQVAQLPRETVDERNARLRAAFLGAPSAPDYLQLEA